MTLGRVAPLLALILLSACGSDDGKDSSSAPTNGTNLPDLPAFAGACTAVVAADFETTGEGFSSLKSSFTAGQKLVVSNTNKWGSDPGEYEVYRANAAVTGVTTLRVPADKVTVDCKTAQNAVIVLAAVTLYTDDTYATAACSLQPTTAPVTGHITSIGYVSSGSDYDGFAQADQVPGSTCPAGQTLHYPLKAESVVSGTTTSTESYQPMANIYVVR